MKLRIVNKNKFIRTISIISCFYMVIILGSQKIYSKGQVNYKNEYILKGDTLWSIAQKEASNNEYYRNRDIRDIIRDIKEINNLRDGNIYDGQQLKIPTL